MSRLVEALARKYLVPIRRSFGLKEARLFGIDCKTESMMDSVTNLARQPQFDMEFDMAKKKAVAEEVVEPKKSKASKGSKATAKEPSVSPIKAAKIGLDAKITILASENPKRAGSSAAAIFDLYKNGMTVEKFLAAGGTRAALNYDVAHEYISVE